MNNKNPELFALAVERWYLDHGIALNDVPARKEHEKEALAHARKVGEEDFPEGKSAALVRQVSYTFDYEEIRSLAEKALALWDENYDAHRLIAKTKGDYETRRPLDYMIDKAFDGYERFKEQGRLSDTDFYAEAHKRPFLRFIIAIAEEAMYVYDYRTMGEYAAKALELNPSDDLDASLLAECAALAQEDYKTYYQIRNAHQKSEYDSIFLADDIYILYKQGKSESKEYLDKVEELYKKNIGIYYCLSTGSFTWIMDGIKFEDDAIKPEPTLHQVLRYVENRDFVADTEGIEHGLPHFTRRIDETFLDPIRDYYGLSSAARTALYVSINNFRHYFVYPEFEMIFKKQLKEDPLPVKTASCDPEEAWEALLKGGYVVPYEEIEGFYVLSPQGYLLGSICYEDDGEKILGLSLPKA